MALMAKDPGDRAEQLIMITERLTALIELERERIEARLPPLEGEEAVERDRLTNAYRLELTRIKMEPELIQGAPLAALNRLKASTKALHEELARHEIALGAVKFVAEGLVQAMAEEITRQKISARGYGAGGGMAKSNSPNPVALDRLA